MNHRFGRAFLAIMFGSVLPLLALAQSDNKFEPTGFESLAFSSFSCTGFVGTPSWHCSPIRVTGYLARANDSRALVVISHGSGGVDRRHSDYARNLAANGINALVLDHWRARGLSMVHRDYNAARLKGGDAPNMTIDVLLAIDALRQRPEWISTKFGYIGESMGASGAINTTRPYMRRVVAELAQHPTPNVDAVVAMYPGCFDRNTQESFAPTPFLFVLAEKDDEAPASACKRQSDWMNQRGGRTEWVELPGQYHDFDAPYRLMRGSMAQNPAKCSNVRDKDTFTLDENGKQYPGTPAGLAEMRKDCIAMTWGGVMTGNNGNPKTGYDVWTKFFVDRLL